MTRGLSAGEYREYFHSTPLNHDPGDFKHNIAIRWAAPVPEFGRLRERRARVPHDLYAGDTGIFVEFKTKCDLRRYHMTSSN